jgi:hypothetical protein
MNLLFLCDSTLGFGFCSSGLGLGVLSLCSSCAYKALLGALFNGACQGFHHSRNLKRSDSKSMPVGGISF